MHNAAPMEIQVTELEQELLVASPERRLRLQPEFGKVLKQLEIAGGAIPARLRNLHDQLLDEAIEARFDNLPI